MPSATPISLAAAVVRRDAAVSKQDVLVAAATAEVAALVAEAARAKGADGAATVLDLSKTEVRRVVEEAGCRLW